MRRRIYALALMAGMLLAAGPASAAQQIDVTPIEAEEGFSPYDMVAMAGGDLLICGSRTVKGERMEEPEHVGYEEMPYRTEAYVLWREADGQTRWTLRLTDPQAINAFTNVWAMADGRFLLRYRNMDGEWGTQYYIVSPEGKVDDMLSSRLLREAGVLDSLQPVPGGYLGGGFRMEFDVIYPMQQEDAIVYLDEDLREIWRCEDALVTGALLEGTAHTEDAFYLCGSRNMPGQGTYRPILIKLSRQTGEVLWHYEGDRYALTEFTSIALTGDGGALLLSSYDPTVPTPAAVEAGCYLTRLDGEGTLLWTKNVRPDEDSYVAAMVPYGEGYLLAGNTLLYVDGEGNTLAHAGVNIDLAEGEHVFLRIAPSPEGGAYVFGDRFTYGPYELPEGDALPPAFFGMLDAGAR